MVWHWLSFCDTSRPKGSQFLGVAIVEGGDPVQAVRRSWEVKANPGGQVLCAPLTPDVMLRCVPAANRNRLLNADEATVLAAAIEGRAP